MTIFYTFTANLKHISNEKYIVLNIIVCPFIMWR